MRTAPSSRRAICAGACALAVSACGGGGGGGATPSLRIPPAATPAPHVDWPTFGYDAQRTGHNPNEIVLSAKNVGGLRLRWSFASGGAIVAQPVVAANVAAGGTTTDLLYVGNEAGTFFALDAASGAPVWREQLGVVSNACGDLPSWGITSTAVVGRAPPAVYVVDGAGVVHALDLAAGRAIPGWPSPPAIVENPQLEYAYSALALATGGILYGTSAGYCDNGTYFGSIVALGAANGVRRSRWTPERAPNWGSGMWGAGGVVADPRPGVRDVYVTTGNGFPSEGATYSDAVIRLTAGLTPVAVSSLWNPALQDDDFGANAVTFVAPGCPPQLAVEQKSGTLDLFDLDAIGGGPVQQIAIGATTNQGYNVNAASWDPVSGTLLIANGSPNGVYAEGLLAFVPALCKLQPLWQAPLGASAQPSPLSQPVVADGVVYYATGLQKTVAAFDVRTGQALWTSPAFRAPVFAAPTVVNGMLYAASLDGTVAAFGL
ncbi:MAG TPA: PQQ-binding-like beta-propeller repeat protein [Candidatus Baltobacteraceae bacterium]|nr:PQQ-binding-like beta-propeller repeat protein [Candidatus Baltobacteraceae bacterium]